MSEMNETSLNLQEAFNRVTTAKMSQMLEYLHDIQNIRDFKPETKSLGIFGGYLALAAGLTVIIVLTIQDQHGTVSRSRRPSTAVFSLFTLLAMVSLGVTWYYMIDFFVTSYDNWAMMNGYKPPKQLAGLYGMLSQSGVSFDWSKVELGKWLKDVKLFKEAWLQVCYTKARYWWSHQIFIITTIWSLFLTIEGSRRNMPNLVALMLLGQLVSVSFAMNLSFLTALLYTVQQPKTKAPVQNSGDEVDPAVYITRIRKTILVVVPIILTFAFTNMIQPSVGSAEFLTNLAVPHVMLFFPLLFSRKAPIESKQEDDPQDNSLSYHGGVWLVTCAVAPSLFIRVSYEFGRELAMNQIKTHGQVSIPLLCSEAARILWTTLFEHPAVSSVGWDVIMSYISAAAWYFVGAGSSKAVDSRKKTN